MAERQALVDPEDAAECQTSAGPNDVAKNMGLKLVFKIAKDVQYQNIFGMNVLTMRI